MHPLFAVILNPDTIVEKNWLNEFIVAYKSNGDGLYQPKILVSTEKNVLFSTGNMIQLFGFGFSRAKGENDQKQFEVDQEVGYASGTCLFTSSKIMNKIGNFDSFLFAFHGGFNLGCFLAHTMAYLTLVFYFHFGLFRFNFMYFIGISL